MDESRKQFEESWLRRGGESSDLILAKGFTVDYSNGFGDAMDAYEENIRAAGIKVKE